MADTARASMRPPVLPSGNTPNSVATSAAPVTSFNEAAGFTQRKLVSTHESNLPLIDSFNEAAGFTQRKRVLVVVGAAGPRIASMRPPVLPSGNNHGYV